MLRLTDEASDGNSKPESKKLDNDAAAEWKMAWVAGLAQQSGNRVSTAVRVVGFRVRVSSFGPPMEASRVGTIFIFIFKKTKFQKYNAK